MPKDFSQVKEKIDSLLRNIQGLGIETGDELVNQNKAILRRFTNQLIEVVQFYKLPISSDKIEEFVLEFIFPEVNKDVSANFLKIASQLVEEVSKYSEGTNAIIGEQSLTNDDKNHEFKKNFLNHAENLESIASQPNNFDNLVDKISHILFDINFFKSDNPEFKSEIISRIERLSFELDDLHTDLSRQLCTKTMNELEEISHYINDMFQQDPDYSDSSRKFS